MARENRVRLSDEEIDAAHRAREARYGEDVAEDVPLGSVIGNACEYYIENEGWDDE